MRLPVYCVPISVVLVGLSAVAACQRYSGESSPVVVQTVLTQAGSPPFQLKATITERSDPSSKTHVEIEWLAPDQWRRTISSDVFSQTLIVNGEDIFEQDAGDYFPIGLQTLVTAMVDPKPVLDALRPGDWLLTKASGLSREDGEVCYSRDRSLCTKTPYGLREVIGSTGHAVEFTGFRDFHGKRVARILIYIADRGEPLTAQISELSDLKSSRDKLFTTKQRVDESKRIRSVVLPEGDLRSQAVATPDIIWPQVLDGATSGSASYYVSLDRFGQVREVFPARSDNERANESACRQIMKWKFKPIIRDGYPVQAESLLTFTLNTRAFGPSSPLSDAEARGLASNIVEPVIPVGSVPSGSTFTLRASIDAEGRLIEMIPGEGEHKMSSPCLQALKQWQFKPLMQDGQPRPYRAEIVFRVP